METNPPTSPSLNQNEPDPIPESPDANGLLCLKGNPGPWIQINSPSHLLVKHLVLDFSRTKDNEIDDSIDQLTLLTHLTILNANNSLKCLPNSISTLLNLQFLKFERCDFKQLPANVGLLKANLTHLTLYKCYDIKSLPETVVTLSNLTSLHLNDCSSVTELPGSLQQLRSLKHFYLNSWYKLRSFPDTLANLLYLKTLSIQGPACDSLKEFPDNLKVSLRHLKVSPDVYSPFAFVRDPINLHHIANLNKLGNLQTLSFCLTHDRTLVKFTDNMEGLDELILLDIQDTTVKYLPWSISKLPKLRLLLLPWGFRLETLPFHLNDSVLISVKGRHIRKTWKQLKQDIGVTFPTAQDECPSIIAPPGYLSLHGDLERWIKNNNESRLLVKMLELELPLCYEKVIKNSVGELPNLTHLFVSNDDRKMCLPNTNTVKGIEHLCLQWYDYKSHFVSLWKFSNLKTLDLIIATFPSKASLPVSLRRLSLRSPDTFSLPASMTMLSNLHTLELSGCYKLSSLPPLNIVTLKIDRIIESLPVGLRNLEIIHLKNDCFDKKCGSSMLEQCLTQLVDLEMLSLTCYDIKSLPRIAGQHNLRVLLVKDCFALKELLPDMELLVELHTLDISGTRIKSLPDSIIKLSKLQQLTLPKCFAQRLSRKLKEVSIIDDTEKIYYEYMGYYDSTFETISDSSEDNDDDEVGSIEGVDEAIIQDPIQCVDDEQACEQNDVISQVPTVSRSTMKRGKNGYGIIWPSNKKMKQYQDAKEMGEPNTDSTCLEKSSEPAQKVSKGAAETMTTVGKPLSENAKESHMEVPQHVVVDLESVKQSNIALLNDEFQRKIMNK